MIVIICSNHDPIPIAEVRADKLTAATPPNDRFKSHRCWKKSRKSRLRMTFLENKRAIVKLDRYEGLIVMITIMTWMPYNGVMCPFGIASSTPLREKSAPGYPAPFAPFWEPTVKHMIHQETSLLETSSLGALFKQHLDTCIPRTWLAGCVWCSHVMVIYAYHDILCIVL